MVFDVFGEYIDLSNLSQEFLVIGFSPSSTSLQQRWKNNGLSANFMADYVTTFFPQTGNHSASRQHQAEIKDAVGFITNELLENAMKFSDEQSNYPITIQVRLSPEKLFFCVKNSIAAPAVIPFQAYIQELLQSDPQEMYIRQVEQNLENETSSRLGYLMMMNDYSAKIGWKFECQSTPLNVITVTTVVSLTV